MSVTVKTFARLADAAGALSSERGARFLAGGMHPSTGWQ